MNVQWSRIARQTPRLRDDVRIHRHRYRGHRWYILRDAVSGRWQRVNEPAYRLIRLLDGRRDLATVRAAMDETEISEHEVVALLDAMNRAELLDWGTPGDVGAMHERVAQARRRKRIQRLSSPFSIRLRLFDPDQFLARQLPLARALFSPAGLCASLVIITVAATLAAVDWRNIIAYWGVRGFTAHNFVLIPVVYVLIKAVHEAAHGLAAKRWGGEVHEMGVVLLLLMPIPYVDASAAWAFPEKHRRVIVGAAGVLSELVLAGLAAIVFVMVEAGIVKDFAYTTMLLGSISTLMFNGNPLLRFDGYYVLADAIEIPNLASRATRYWGYLVQRYLFGIREVRSPVSARGERGWFILYGAAASLYRITITFAIALFVAARLPVLGVALAVWALVSQIGVPLVRHGHFVLRAPLLCGRRRRAVAVAGAALIATLTVSLALPMPLSTYAEGVIWLPESAHIRAGGDGTVGAVFVTGNQAVVANVPLLRLDNPLLHARIAALEWEIAEREARYAAARSEDRVRAQVVSESIRSLRKDLAALRAQAASLIVTSPVGGALVIPKVTHLAGRFVRKGDVIGYVLESTAPTVRATVSQAAIGTLRRGVRRVTVRLAEYPRITINAVISREVPSATRRLPSAALGTLGGGRVPVNPSEQSRAAAKDGLYLIDLTLSERPPSPRVGGRVHVRFEHAAEPLGFRIYRAARQLLLARLAV
jgi:putative peptide zinc metalloprotease protein